jgi:hypothetical protein
LFSREDVASFMNRYFEPVWESVRPVPLVRIDFGNGTVVTRTLNGNIATYACTAEGQVLDVLPGIYAPAAYLHQLDQLRLLANFAEQEGSAGRTQRLRDYHQAQAASLRKNGFPAVFVNMVPITKAKIERAVKAVLVEARAGRRLAEVEATLPGPADSLATWKPLAEDTRVNETARRLQIHEHLADAGRCRPKAVTHWLYREVLHADLDDPYLGLRNVLFAGYPFSDQTP